MNWLEICIYIMGLGGFGVAWLCTFIYLLTV